MYLEYNVGTDAPLPAFTTAECAPDQHKCSGESYMHSLLTSACLNVFSLLNAFDKNAEEENFVISIFNIHNNKTILKIELNISLYKVPEYCNTQEWPEARQVRMNICYYINQQLSWVKWDKGSVRTLIQGLSYQEVMGRSELTNSGFLAFCLFKYRLPCWLFFQKSRVYIKNGAFFSFSFFVLCLAFILFLKTEVGCIKGEWRRKTQHHGGLAHFYFNVLQFKLSSLQNHHLWIYSYSQELRVIGW